MAEVVIPIAWIGSTKKELLAMPEVVQKEFGFILFQVQCGKMHLKPNP
jgi:phage-related protein